MNQKNTPRTAEQILEEIKQELQKKKQLTASFTYGDISLENETQSNENASEGDGFADFSEDAEPMKPQTMESAESDSDVQNKDAAKRALKWAVSRPMDDKGFTGAYERYHTNHGTAVTRLSEEKKQEIRERVSRTLAEGILGAGQTASFAKVSDMSGESRSDKAEKPDAADVFEPQDESLKPETSSEPIPSDSVEQNSVTQSGMTEKSNRETELSEKRGIVTGETVNGEPFNYADFKAKRANAVKEFFNNMHEFTFTRTNQEAVEMLHMHQQTGTSFAEQAELNEETEQARRKKEEEIYQERVENLRHIITGEKKMTLLRLGVTGILTLLAVLFLGLNSEQNELFWFGASAIGWLVGMLQVVLLLIGATMSINVYMGAWQLIKHRRFGKEILVAAIYTAGILMSVITAVSPAVMYQDYYTSYTFLYLLTMTSYHLGMHLQMSRLKKQFEKTAAANSKLRCSLEPLENRFLLQNLDLHRKDGSLVIKQVKADVIAGFEDHCFAPDWFDRLTKPLLIGLCGLAFLAALGAGIMAGDFHKALFAFTATFGFCSPFAAMYAAELPMQRTEKDAAEQFDEFSILHADAVEEMANATAVIVSSEEIFPPESVLLHGLRSAAGVRVDEAILDAVSILTAGKSVLAPTFLQMISDKTELLKPVDSITYEDGMGISAWVDNNRVLIGSRKLMENHNIRMPSHQVEQVESDKGRMILYLAKQGELISVFSVSLQVLPQIKRLLGQARSQGTRIYVRSVDCLIENHLLTLFGEDADIIGILPSRLHADYEKETNRKDAAQSLVISDGSLSAALHASMQIQRLRASLEMIRLLVVVLLAVIGIYFAAAVMAGTSALFGGLACLVPVLIYALFFVIKSV